MEVLPNHPSGSARGQRGAGACSRRALAVKLRCCQRGRAPGRAVTGRYAGSGLRAAVALALLFAGWLGPGSRAAIAATPTPEAVAEAKQLVRQGNAHYQRGNFQEALKAYDRAYELNPRPTTLFNMAQCHRQLQSYEKASFLY